MLALDTSTSRGEVAVWRDGEVVFEKGFESERSHNAQMFAPLREALEVVGDGVDMVVVGTGPGSYTGVRIGIAAAQGVGWSRAALVVGVASLLAPGVEGELPAEWVMCGDARRGQFYAVKVVAGRLQGQIETVSKEELLKRKEEWRSLRWMSYDAKSPAELLGVELMRPSARRLAQLVVGMSEVELDALKDGVLEPVYLSAPFVTMAKQGKV